MHAWLIELLAVAVTRVQVGTCVYRRRGWLRGSSAANRCLDCPGRGRLKTFVVREAPEEYAGSPLYYGGISTRVVSVRRDLELLNRTSGERVLRINRSIHRFPQ